MLFAHTWHLAEPKTAVFPVKPTETN